LIAILDLSVEKHALLLTAIFAKSFPPESRIMGFNKRHQPAPISELNLVPMMDVLMAILIFFIVISMTLSTGHNVLGVNLPKTEDGKSSSSSDSKTPDPIVIGINPQGQVLIQNKPVSPSELQTQIQAYFQKTPQGIAVIQADRNLAYEKVTKVLGQVRAVGGDRVALAIDK
jgi:biopolymer transport protein ExbD